nr:hypothetical protein [Tanacetum cinerariifolium]
MHILNEPSFFLMNKPGAPQGEELGLIKPLSERSCSCSDNSFNSDEAKRYGPRVTGAAPRIRSIWNFTDRAGGRPGKFSENTLGKSWMIGFVPKRNSYQLLITHDHGMMSPQPVHTDNGIETTQFYGHKMYGE